MVEDNGGKFQAVWGWLKAHVIVAMAASLLLGASLSSVGADATPAEEQTSLQTKLDSVQAKLSAVENEAEERTVEANQLRGENEKLQGEIESLEEQVLRLNAKRPLPKLTNGTEEKATQLADQYGWNVQVKRRYSTSPVGFVLSQRPSPGTAMRYQALVNVVVAKKIPKIPNLVGLRKGQAASAAKRAGYRVEMSYAVSTKKPGNVIATSPGGGTRLIPGNTLSITIAKKAPPPPPTPPPPPEPNCTPGYDPCLPPASDYDCLGGSGDGPKYTGPVRVTGSDPYGLDADGDGLGCE